MIAQNVGTMANVAVVDGFLQFNGSTSEVDFGTLTAGIENIFDGGGTLAYWVRPHSDGEVSQARVADTTDAVGNSGGWIAYVRDEVSSALRPALSVEFTTADAVWRSATAFPLNQWSFVCITYNADSAANLPTIDINGIPVAIEVIQAPVGTRRSDAGNSLFVGNNATAARTFDGDIQSLFFYSDTLDRSQRERLFNVTNPSLRPDSIGVSSTVTSGQSALFSGGYSSAGAGGAFTLQGGDVTTGTGGSVVLRGGDSSAGAGGNITLRSGSTTSTGTTQVQVYAGTITAAGWGGLSNSVFIHGADKTSGGSGTTAGGVNIRAGESTGGGGAHGGNLLLAAGSVTTFAGAARGGYTYLRSGQNAGNASGTVWITTSNNGVSPTGIRTGDMYIGTAQATTEPTIPTVPPVWGSTTNIAGNVEIRTGSSTRATGQGAGDITLACGGNWNSGSGSSPIGGNINLYAGNNFAGNGTGGTVFIGGGNHANTAFATGNDPGGSVTLLAGYSASNNPTSPGGAINLTAGAATHPTDGGGGDANLTAGNGKGTGVNGNVVLTPGTGGTGGGQIQLLGPTVHTGATLGFFSAPAVAQSPAYTPTNVTTDRSYDANATTVAELADVLGTLISDLKALGLIG
jgi:hypothetical protein